MLHGTLVLLVAAVIFSAQSSPAKTPDARNPTKAWEKAAPEGVEDLMAIQRQVDTVWESARHAIVGVKAHEGEGSGVVVSEDGYVLTAGHVSGEPGRMIELYFEDGSSVTAETLGLASYADSGMAKITEEGKWPFVPMAKANSYQSGDWCIAIGNPNGYDKDRGFVLRLGRIISIFNYTIRTDCKIVGGDSGGPLFDMDGNVIGIHSRISFNKEDNYHATIEAFKKDWNKLVDGRELRVLKQHRRGFLGIEMAEVDNGVLVRNVVPKSAAEVAGILAGDIITHINSDKVESVHDLTIAIGMHKPDEEIAVKLLREEKVEEFPLRLGSWRK